MLYWLLRFVSGHGRESPTALIAVFLPFRASAWRPPTHRLAETGDPNRGGSSPLVVSHCAV
eukprot:2543126-Prymnesium_polylepis.1